MDFRFEAREADAVDPGYRTGVQLLKYNYSLLYFRYLAGITLASHTGFTYHRTWETGLEEVTRVSSSNPLSLPGGFPNRNSIIGISNILKALTQAKSRSLVGRMASS